MWLLPKTACEPFHTKFLVSCKFCRQNFCKTFENGKEYIENFIKDFLNLSDQTIESSYKVIIKRILVEKTFQVKSM